MMRKKQSKGGVGTNQYAVRGTPVGPHGQGTHGGSLSMVASGDTFKMMLNQVRTDPVIPPDNQLGEWDTVDLGDGQPPCHVLDIDSANEVSAQAMWLETGDEADGSECTPQDFPGRPSYWVSVVSERNYRLLDDEAYVDTLDEAKKWVQEKVASGDIDRAMAQPPA